MSNSPKAGGVGRSAVEVPVVNIIQDTSGVKMEDSKPEDWATFVALPTVGKGHTIQIERSQEQLIQEAGMSAPRPVPVRGSGRRIRFAEGTFQTNDPELIAELTTGPRAVRVYNFGTDYDINRTDPTGYWRKHGWPFIKEEKFVITGSPALVDGPVTSMSGARV